MTRYIRWASTALLTLALLSGGALCALAQQATGQLVIVPKKGDPNQLISFSFQQADIDDVLRFLADASGKIVFKDSSVSTTITIRNQSRIKVSEAIRLVRILLSFKGYSLQETPDALIVTTAEVGKRKYGGDVSVGKDVTSIPAGNQIITHIFPLANVDAVRIQQELLPLFPAATNTIIADGDTNSLIVVDEADVVRRIGQLVAQLDRNLTDELNLEVIRLKYADATEVARYMTDLFKQDDQSAAAGQQRGGGGGGGFPGAPGVAAPGGAGTPARGGLAQLRGRVRFAADQRSNSLLVYANPNNIKQIQAIVAQIDVNLAPRTEYQVVDLKYADASALSDQLNQLLDPSSQSGNRGNTGAGFFFGGGGAGRTGSTGNTANEKGLQEFKVVPDVRTNSLIVTAPVDAITSLIDLVKRLDQPSMVKDVVRVFQLQNAIASEVTTTLRNLFQGTQQTGGTGFALFGGGNRTQIPANSPLDLLRQVTIVANDQTNQLLVSGPAQTFPVIEQLIQGTDGLDRRLPQVFIEVVIADVTLDDTTKFGIEWNATSGTSTFGTNFGLTSPTANNTGFRYSIVSKNFQATLQALGSTSRLKVISTPHILVTDNSPALVTIGESIPYAGSTTITNGLAQSSVAFQDVAITLNVTPHISPGNHILMDIDQVVNNLIEFIDIGQGQTAPRTTNRRAGTTVIVKNDQTVVLGGIISKNDQKTVNKVPILGDLPLIGNFFRNTSHDLSRSELVVFLTPHVVREPEDADQLRDYERQRLNVDPLKNVDAPFARPLEINPSDLKRLRDQASPPASGRPSVPGSAPSPDPALPMRNQRGKK